MKIRIEMTNKEIVRTTLVAAKYDPRVMESELKDETHELKMGKFTTKKIDGAYEVNCDFNEDFILESIAFLDEIIAPVANCLSHLKFIFEGAAERFKKWGADEWESVAKHISKENAGKAFLLGLTKTKEWVERDATHKMLTDTYMHTPITEIGDIGDVINQADANKNEWRIVKFTADGKFEISNDVCVAAKWAEDMGMGYFGKRVAE